MNPVRRATALVSVLLLTMFMLLMATPGVAVADQIRNMDDDPEKTTDRFCEICYSFKCKIEVLCKVQCKDCPRRIGEAAEGADDQDLPVMATTPGVAAGQNSDAGNLRRHCSGTNGEGADERADHHQSPKPALSAAGNPNGNNNTELL